MESILRRRTASQFVKTSDRRGKRARTERNRAPLWRCRRDGDTRHNDDDARRVIGAATAGALFCSTLQHEIIPAKSKRRRQEGQRRGGPRPLTIIRKVMVLATTSIRSREFGTYVFWRRLFLSSCRRGDRLAARSFSENVCMRRRRLSKAPFRQMTRGHYSGPADPGCRETMPPQIRRRRLD